MGKFILGLIVGLVVGVMAMAANPDLPQELRVWAANLTAQVMRTAGETAEEIGDAAEEVTEGVEPPADAAPAATEPATPNEAPRAGQPQ